MVTKQQRRLLLVSELVTNGRPNLAWLYLFLDASGVQIGTTLLAPHYREIHVLTGSKATAAGFVSRLAALCKKPGTKAVDVILQLHGSETRLWFHGSNQSIKVAELAAQVAAKNLGHRLRLFYSLACVAAAHAPLWVEAGFATASGARGTNCNSATDYPGQLTAWAAGMKYGACVKVGNAQPGRGIADAAGTEMGFSDADSFKVIAGNKNLTITSPAD